MADSLSKFETNGHDTVKIDDGFPDGAIASDSDAFGLRDVYEDRHLFVDTIVETDAITSVTTRS